MNNEIIHTQIQGLLETIQEQYDLIRSTEGRIPQIELDILLDNIRKLYDHLHHLNVRAGHTPTVQTGHTPSVQTGHAPSLHSTHAPSVHASPPSPRPEIKSVERPKAAVGKEDEAKKKATQTADMDLFADEEPTFNMKLQEAREMSLPPKAEPIGHLKELVSINDKFIFINELFDGNLKEYNEAVDTLNGFREKNDAFDHLNMLRNKNLWDLGSGTFMKLKEIVERKY